MVAPFTSDASRWYDLDWINIYEKGGKTYHLARPDQRRRSDAEAKTYGDVVSQYRWHPEAKSLGPNGRPCTDDSAGTWAGSPVRRCGRRSDPPSRRVRRVCAVHERVLIILGARAMGPCAAAVPISGKPFAIERGAAAPHVPPRLQGLFIKETFLSSEHRGHF